MTDQTNSRSTFCLVADDFVSIAKRMKCIRQETDFNLGRMQAEPENCGGPAVTFAAAAAKHCWTYGDICEDW